MKRVRHMEKPPLPITEEKRASERSHEKLLVSYTISAGLVFATISQKVQWTIDILRRYAWGRPGPILETARRTVNLRRRRLPGSWDARRRSLDGARPDSSYGGEAQQ